VGTSTTKEAPMDTRSYNIATHQHQALDFMLDALGLQHVKDEAHRAARLMELEQQVPALLSENRRLRRRVVELEHELNRGEAELDAFKRAMDNRIDDERERRLDDI
jgi:predicted RNase H-like nuclease (RuvC/YqgF family)